MEISPLSLSLLLMFSFLYGICIGIVNDINRIVRVFFGVRYTKINFNKLYEFYKIAKKENSDNSISSKATNIYLNILIFIQDIFLTLFAASGIILLNYYFNDGRFRQCAAVRRYIDLHFKEPLTLDLLAEEAHMNKYYLSHAFKREFGVSPINYMISRRLEESKYLLAETDLSMSQIAQLLGFSSLSYFSQVFRKTQGLSPMEYRQDNKRV